MKGNILEAIIGAFVLIVASFFVYFAYTSSGEKIKDGYTLIAKFDDASGIGVGSDIKMNGVKIGVVQSIKLTDGYQARIELVLKKDVKVPQDSTASVTTDGLMGNKFIAISAGSEEESLDNMEEIELTKSSMNLESLIDQFVLDKTNSRKK